MQINISTIWINNFKWATFYDRKVNSCQFTILYWKKEETSPCKTASQEFEVIWGNCHQEDLNHSINCISIDHDTETVTLISQYSNIFHRTGQLKNYTACFYIDKLVSPVTSPAWPIPFHQQKLFHKERGNMKDQTLLMNMKDLHLTCPILFLN